MKMTMRTVLVVVVVTCLVVLTEGYNTKRGVFSCKERGDACWGIVRCCDELVCYWENGLSITSSGYCVTCVGGGQVCLSDDQCCEGFQCERGYKYHTSGTCSLPKPVNSPCYRHEQCQSGRCKLPYFGQTHGKCLN